jgi:hypothetical protein
MSTAEKRGRYDRRVLRYPSDLTDDEWGLEPLIPLARRGGNKRHVGRFCCTRSTTSARNVS